MNLFQIIICLVYFISLNLRLIKDQEAENKSFMNKYFERLWNIIQEGVRCVVL